LPESVEKVSVFAENSKLLQQNNRETLFTRRKERLKSWQFPLLMEQTGL
jgi:hypothetical protein